ncbi:MAG: DUF5677 domain-containing protein [Myxococcaceae bacterium]
MNVDEHGLPDPPVIQEELLAHCRSSGDFRPILFEWYKFVALLANFFARLRADSPGVRQLPPVHYAALIGLLNRIYRLMTANVALSHEGSFGETTAIVDRCIFESGVKLAWLCTGVCPDAFERFIGDGLRTELEFEKEILTRVQQRGGQVQVIEKRMLASIERHIVASGLSRTQISNCKKVPDMASMIDALGHERLLYVVGQRIGSHHVHGTWPSLRMHYLEDDEGGRLRPRDHDCETHVNQFHFIPLAVLESITAFLAFVVTDESFMAAFRVVLNGTTGEIMKISEEFIGTDFEAAPQE